MLSARWRIAAAIVLAWVGFSLAKDLISCGRKKSGLFFLISDAVLALACLCRGIYELSI